MKIMFSRTLFAMFPKPLSCRLIAPLLVPYVAKTALSRDERHRIQAHLSTCPNCQEEREALQMMGTFLRDRGPAALPVATSAADLWERIETQIIAQDSAKRRSPSLRPTLVFVPALAAITVAVILLPHLSPAPTSRAVRRQTQAVALAKEKPDFSAAPNALEDKQTVAPSLAMIPAPRRIPKSSDFLADNLNLRHTVPVLVAKPAAHVAARHSKNVNLETRYITIVPVTKPTPTVTVVASSGPKPAAAFLPIEIVDVKPTPSTTGLATNTTPVLVSVSESRPVMAAGLVVPDSNTPQAREPIMIVSSNPGNGVPATNSLAPSVTDTLIRQRQKRGLFGGYSAGSATLTTLPTGGNSSSGGENTPPW